MKKQKIAIISLTYNRSEYIKRSFCSLYQRAGLSFNHYVFDDMSDVKTQNVLKKLQKKFGFKLILRKRHFNIAKNFMRAINALPKYDYYLKFDSDIEILSENLLMEMLEVFNLNNVKCAVPRVEGMYNLAEKPNDIQFYNGHVISFHSSINFGGCMLFDNLIRLYKEPKKIIIGNKKYGIDSRLLNFIVQQMNKKLVSIEDLSVYHIDNTYGQRKKYDIYFTNRKRWSKIDIKDVWFMRASQLLRSEYIKTEIYEKIEENSINYKEFLMKCKEYLKTHNIQLRQVEKNKKKQKQSIKK